MLSSNTEENGVDWDSVGLPRAYSPSPNLNARCRRSVMVHHPAFRFGREYIDHRKLLAVRFE